MNRTLLMGIAGTLCALAFQNASAQWAWKDDAGHTVFSDQPPPSNIPPARIVKGPQGGGSAPAPAPAPAPVAGSDAQKSLADQDLEFKKRLKDNADAAKKAQDTQVADAAKQQRCSDARTSLNTINSGQRLATTDAQGNRVYLDDSQREATAQRAQAALSGC